jgi:hypothetical protein
VRARPEPLFAASAAAGLIVLAWLYSDDAPVRLGLDTFHHLASVRELARGEFPPRHNLVDDRVPQGHYGPYLVAVGALARWTGASPRLALYAAGLAGMAAFLLAFRVARPIARARAARWSALARSSSRPVALARGAMTSAGWPGATSIRTPGTSSSPSMPGWSCSRCWPSSCRLARGRRLTPRHGAARPPRRWPVSSWRRTP